MVAPAREFGSRWRMPCTDALQRGAAGFDAFWPRGLQNYWKSTNLAELSDEAIDTLVTTSWSGAVAADRGGPGAFRRGHEPGPADATAFPHRQSDYDLSSPRCGPTRQRPTHIAWTQVFWEALQPFATDEVYVNYLGVEGEERVRAAYGHHYDRLVALKNQYDPTTSSA